MPSVLSKGMLPQEKVSTLMNFYGKPMCVMRLGDLAIGYHNRPISWKYVHSLLRSFMEENGFSALRYKYATAAEPPDDDECRDTKRHQKEAAMSGGMLATVDVRKRNGLLTKNHLLCCLLLLLDGRIKKDHDHESVWAVPPKDGTARHKELHEALEMGLKVMLLDKSIWQNEALADIMLIVDADNQDSFTTCPDSECHLWKRIRALIDREEAKVANPQVTVFERVYAQLKNATGPFSKADVTHLYNCAKKLPDPFLAFVTKFHFQWINPSVLRVQPKLLGCVGTSFPDAAPWLKACLIVMCYLCSPEYYVEVGAVQYANALEERKLAKLSENEAFIAEVEEFVSYCIRGCQPFQDELNVFNATVVFADTIGKLVYKKGVPKGSIEGNRFGDRREQYARVESDLWDVLRKYGVDCKSYLGKGIDKLEDDAECG